MPKQINKGKKITHWVAHKFFYLPSLHIMMSLWYINVFFNIFRIFIYFFVRHLGKSLMVHTTDQKVPPDAISVQAFTMFTRHQHVIGKWLKFVDLWMENGKQGYGSYRRLRGPGWGSLYTARREENCRWQEWTFRYKYCLYCVGFCSSVLTIFFTWNQSWNYPGFQSLRQ